MKKNFLLQLLLIGSSYIAASAQGNFAGPSIVLPPTGENQKSEIVQHIGLVQVKIIYNSPNVTSPAGENRTGHIWGELIPFGFYKNPFPSLSQEAVKEIPWRAGANENTIFTVSHDVLIDGKPLKAGTYALYVVINKDSSAVIIFSTRHENWGAFYYLEKFDALRIQTKLLNSEFNEWLQYGFDDRFVNKATAFLKWEHKKLVFKIEVPDASHLYLDLWRKEMTSVKGFYWQNWYEAVLFSLRENSGNWEECLLWINRAIAWNTSFKTLSAKAEVLEKLGRQTTADSVLLKAIYHYNSSPADLIGYANSLLSKKKTEKAFEVFSLIETLHPNFKHQVYMSMARAYWRLADKTNAIAHFDKAISNWPAAEKDGLESAKREVEFYKKQQ
jgi:tetratricopeptide (TPR) repeat protein